MKRTIYLAAAALAATCGAQAGAQGSPSDFLRCDGYGVPTQGGDAMTHGAGGINIFSNARSSRELRRQVPALGRAGIESCTAALADARLLPGERIRRASLLHARALHRLAVDDAPGALEDLDLAETEAADGDALIDRSVGLSLRLTRAFALLKSGRAGEAAAIASGVVAERPFEPALAYAAARLHFDATHDWAAYVARVRTLAAVDPNLITSLYALAIYRGEYADAIALHPQIVMSMPRARGGYEIVGIHDIAAEQVTMRAWIDGGHAYALEAQGDAAGADAAVAAAKADLEAALAPPVRPDGRRPGRQQRQRHAAIDRRRQEATEALAVWERHIRLRRLANDDRVDEVLADLRREPVPSDTAAIALLEQIAAVRPAMRDEVRSVVGRLRERIYASIEQIMAFGPRELLEHLPEPESRQRLPDYDPAGGAFRIAARDGYRTRRGPLEGVRTVRFSSPRGSIAIANELALLRSAQLARESGRRGLIVIARRGMVRTLNTTGFGGVPLQRPTGQEVEIDVLLVDPANLPPDYVDARWRVLDPDAIWAALSPIYPAPAVAAAR